MKVESAGHAVQIVGDKDADAEAGSDHDLHLVDLHVVSTVQHFENDEGRGQRQEVGAEEEVAERVNDLGLVT